MRRTLLVTGAVAPGLLGIAWAASATPRPDPAARQPVAAPASLTQGTSTATWSFTLANRGKAKAKRFGGGVYLSKDATKSSTDIGLGKVPAKPLAAGAKRKVVVSLVVPLSTPLGSYRLIACAAPAKSQKQVTKRNDCVTAASSSAIVAPPPDAPTLTSISEDGRGSTLTPSVHGGSVPPGSTVTAYGSSTCQGPAVGSTQGEPDGTFDVAYVEEIEWGATVTLAVKVTSDTGTSACSNALTYTHRGQTYTWNGTDAWTGPATIPVDSLVRLINAPEAIPHFTDAPEGADLPPHGNISAPGTT